jgi:quercetin dioxygenase-like cupin family protein
MADAKNEAVAAQLSSLIDFQNDSIVSREIIKKPTGTVTLFAFDEGQGLSEHTTPFDAMVQAIEGKFEITISGKPYILEAGDMIVMPAGEPHALKALRKFKMLLVMIRS